MPHSGSDSTYPAVQISGTTSLVVQFHLVGTIINSESRQNTSFLICWGDLLISCTRLYPKEIIEPRLTIVLFDTKTAKDVSPHDPVYRSKNSSFQLM